MIWAWSMGITAVRPVLTVNIYTLYIHEGNCCTVIWYQVRIRNQHRKYHCSRAMGYMVGMSEHRDTESTTDWGNRGTDIPVGPVLGAQKGSSNMAYEYVCCVCVYHNCTCCKPCRGSCV